MADQTPNGLRTANPAQIPHLEQASALYSQQLHERQSAREAALFTRAAIDTHLNRALLELAQKGNKELGALLELAKEQRQKRTREKKPPRQPGMDPEMPLVARAQCQCSGGTPTHPETRVWPGAGVSGSGWTNYPVSGREACIQWSSGAATQFTMGNGPFLPQQAAGTFSPFLVMTENAISNSQSLASGRTMLGIPWGPAPVNGSLSFSGQGSWSGEYSLDCAFAMAETDAHIGTSIWDLGDQAGSTPVSMTDGGDIQVWGPPKAQSNWTNQTQDLPVTPFNVSCASIAGATCPGVPVTAGHNYVLWIYFELNAFQGTGANSWPDPVYAEVFSIFQIFLMSINWTLTHPMWWPVR